MALPTAGAKILAADYLSIMALGDDALSYVPTLTQSATPAKTVEFANYTQVGDWCFVNVALSVTGAGTAANAVVIGLPPLTFANFRVLGTGAIFDASASIWYQGAAVWASATTCMIWPGATTTALGVSSFTAALAVGDKVCLNLAAKLA